MSKWKKVALIMLAALVLIVAALAIIIPMLCDVDRYRPQVTAEIQQKTGKPAQIGRLSLAVFPEVAIRVDDFSLGNPRGFPTGDFVKARKIYALIDPFALMHREVEITSLELDHLTLNMLEDAHGKWNFESPPAKADPPGDPQGAGSTSFKLGIISRLTVTAGEFAAGNVLPSGAAGPSLMEVHGATIDLRQVDLNALTTASLREPASAPGEFAALTGWFNTVVYAADQKGPAVAQGTLKADSLKFVDLAVTNVKSKFRIYPKQAFFDDLDLKCYGGTATGNLSLNFAGANLSYRTDARVKGVNVEEFLNAFPQARGMMTGTLEGTAKLSGIIVHSSDPLAGITGSGQASVRNGSLPTLQLNSNLRTLARIASIGPAQGDPSSFSSISADFRIANARLSSNKIVVVGNGLDVDGSGSLTTAGEGSLDYQGNAGLAASGTNPLASVLGGLAGAKFENGKMTFPFAVSGTFAKPKFALKSGAAGQGTTAPANVQQPADLVRGISGLFKKKKQQ